MDETKTKIEKKTKTKTKTRTKTKTKTRIKTKRTTKEKKSWAWLLVRSQRSVVDPSPVINDVAENNKDRISILKDGLSCSDLSLKVWGQKETEVMPPYRES